MKNLDKLNNLYSSNSLLFNIVILILVFILGFIFLINITFVIKISFLIIVIILLSIFYLKNKELKNSKLNESFKNNHNKTNEYIFNNNDFHNRTSYDNLILKPSNSCWRKNPSNVPLLSSNNLYVPQGTPINQNKKNNSFYTLNNDSPPVDGIDETRKSLFTFAFNQCRPECCPSTYSCDKGCICSTEQQRKFINQRGIVNYPKNTESIF
jgi:hypothetical protein